MNPDTTPRDEWWLRHSAAEQVRVLRRALDGSAPEFGSFLSLLRSLQDARRGAYPGDRGRSGHSQRKSAMVAKALSSSYLQSVSLLELGSRMAITVMDDSGLRDLPSGLKTMLTVVWLAPGASGECIVWSWLTALWTRL